jgi:hypothetical protein
MSRYFGAPYYEVWEPDWDAQRFDWLEVPGLRSVFTVAEIIEISQSNYFIWKSRRSERTNFQARLQDFIEDWIVVNWATPIFALPSPETFDALEKARKLS